MDVNAQMPNAGVPEHDNAQLTHVSGLAVIRPSARPFSAPLQNVHPQGVEKCLRVTPCARVSVHEVVVAPELALSRRTLASL